MCFSDVDILMKDGCTKKEAVNHLKRGCEIIEDLAEHFIEYMKEWCVADDDIDSYKKMVIEKKPLQDWGIVEIGEKVFYIRYVL